MTQQSHPWLGSLYHFAHVAQRLVRSAAPGSSSAVCVDIVIGEEPGHGSRDGNKTLLLMEQCGCYRSLIEKILYFN